MSGVAYSYYTLNTPRQSDNSVNYTPLSEEEKQTGEDIKEQIVNDEEDKPQGSDPLPQPEPQNDGSKPIVGVNVVAAINNGENYRVQTFIQAVTNNGQCTLSITDSTGKAYSAVTDVQALPSSSTCKGFTIPNDELSSGKWIIDLRFENESLRGSVVKEMEVT